MRTAVTILLAVAALCAAFLFKAAYDETYGREKRQREAEAAENARTNAIIQEGIQRNAGLLYQRPVVISPLPSRQSPGPSQP